MPITIPTLAATAGTFLVVIPSINIPMIGTLYKPLIFCKYVKIDSIFASWGAIRMEIIDKYQIVFNGGVPYVVYINKGIFVYRVPNNKYMDDSDYDNPIYLENVFLTQ